MHAPGVARRRPTARHSADISLGTITARAAFSHVPFWQSLMGIVSRIVSRPTPGNIAAPPRRHSLMEQVTSVNAVVH